MPDAFKRIFPESQLSRPRMSIFSQAQPRIEEWLEGIPPPVWPHEIDAAEAAVQCMKDSSYQNKALVELPTKPGWQYFSGAKKKYWSCSL